jgi:FkbM family methyltransferase
MWERWVIVCLSAALMLLMVDRQRLLKSSNQHHLQRQQQSGENQEAPQKRQLSTLQSTSTQLSRKCSIQERDFQQNNFELAGLHICDKDLIWQLIHLALPDIQVFLDIGGNLGYTAARIFGLWSPGHQFNRVSLFEAMEESVNRRVELNLTSNLNQRTTFCRDGHYRDTAFVCIGQEHRPSNDRFAKPCITRRNIQVYSFDGQLQHVENQQRIIYHHFPHLHPKYPQEFYNDSTRVHASWTYIHAALTSKLLPRQQSGSQGDHKHHRIGYFKVDDNEHGQLVQDPMERDQMIAEGLKKRRPENIQFIEVPLLTIDVFVQEQGLSTVDVIKVDAEGSDIEVIQGGFETILNKDVKVITFECTDCLIKERYEPFFQMIDEQYGFDCYLHGINQIVVKMTGDCWDYSREFYKPRCKHVRKCPYYLHKKNDHQWSRGAIDSNAYCIHRSRAAVLHGLVENIALYHYVDEKKRGHFLKDAFLSVDEVDFLYSQNLSDWSFRRTGKNKTMIWYHRMYGRDIRSGEKYDMIIPEIG